MYICIYRTVITDFYSLIRTNTARSQKKHFANLYSLYHTINRAAFVCLSVCSLSPPRSFDRSSPNLVGVCRWTSELPLRGSFSKRSTARRVNGSLSLSTILYMCQPHSTQLQKATLLLLHLIRLKGTFCSTGHISLYCKMPIIRVLEIFALFASSKRTRQLQARELPGWTIPWNFTPRIIGVLQYFWDGSGVMGRMVAERLGKWGEVALDMLQWNEWSVNVSRNKQVDRYTYLLNILLMPGMTAHDKRSWCF